LVINDLTCINTRTGKVLRSFSIRWEFPSLGWVKINTDGAARGYPGLAACESIFRGNMREFIRAFSAFLDVQTAILWSYICFGGSSKVGSY